MKRSTFVKRGTNSATDSSGFSKGTRIWNNGLVVTSIGLDKLDSILGLGVGVPLGSIVLLEQDYPSTYWKLFEKLFSAEGIHQGHCLIRCQALDRNILDKQTFLDSIPGKAAPRTKTVDKEVANNSSMKIAWRYERYVNDVENVAKSSNMGQSSQALKVGKICFDYDLRKKVDSKEMKVEIIDVFSEFRDVDSMRKNPESALTQLFSNLSNVIHSVGKDRVVRIVISSLGDPRIWPVSHELILDFLMKLRSLIDGTKILVLASIAKTLISPAYLTAFEGICDAVLEVDSFKSKDHGFGDFDGVLAVKKFFSVGNSLPDTQNYLLKAERKGLIIEKMSLPPEESRTGGSTQDARLYQSPGNIQEKLASQSINPHNVASDF